MVESQPSLVRNVGSPVTATDTDQGDTLTYTLGGVDAAAFTIVPGTGQIQTAIVLDQETRSRYAVTVTANDGTADSAPLHGDHNRHRRDLRLRHPRRGGRPIEQGTGKSDCEALLEARNKLEDGGARLNWWQGTPVAGLGRHYPPR